MTANISQVSEGLAGKGATNVKLYFDQLQVQINNAITSGDLTKFTPASSLTSGPGAPSSQPPSSQAHPPAEKRYKCDQCEQSFSRSNELQNHKVSKHGSGLSCNLCDHEPFQSAAALKLHQTKANGQGTAKMYKFVNTLATGQMPSRLTRSSSMASEFLLKKWFLASMHLSANKNL